jgi:hypothetical protein
MALKAIAAGRIAAKYLGPLPTLIADPRLQIAVYGLHEH